MNEDFELPGAPRFSRFLRTCAHRLTLAEPVEDLGVRKWTVFQDDDEIGEYVLDGRVEDGDARREYVGKIPGHIHRDGSRMSEQQFTLIWDNYEDVDLGDGTAMLGFTGVYRRHDGHARIPFP